MKHVQKCVGCGKPFDFTKENEVERQIGSVKDFSRSPKHKCPSCGVENEMTYADENNIPSTLEEAVDIVKCLQEGRNNKYLHGDVELKIGEFKCCKKCGKVTDVVQYNGLMSYQKNFSTMCDCEPYPVEDDWFEPCGSDKCEVHKDLDVERLRDERKDFALRQDIVKKIFAAMPPKNDGVLELDRMAFMFSEMYMNCSINDSRSWVFGDFILYCARNGLLTR